MKRLNSVLLVMLLAVLFVVAGCSSDDGAANEPARSDEIEALIGGYLASWEAKDEQALRASVTDDFIINEYQFNPKGSLVEAIHDNADGIVKEGFAFDWQNEIVGEAIWEGDGPWIVAYREHWEQKGTQYDGIATYAVIVDDDGTLKIANHHWAGIDWFEN
jgi:hypothetical protein